MSWSILTLLGYFYLQMYLFTVWRMRTLLPIAISVYDLDDSCVHISSR